MSAADDFFGGNAKSASFNGQPGITWHGVIDRVGEPVQATEYSNQPGVIGKPKFYPSGDPVMQLPVTIVTEVRDPADPADDGRRTIYFDGEKRKAMKLALQRAGVRGPAVGDWLSLTYTADQQGAGANPKKLFVADYAVNPNKGAGFFGGEAAPVAAPQPTFQAPAPAAAPVQNAGPWANGAPADNPANAWPPAASTEAPAPVAQPQAEAAMAGAAAANGAPQRPWGLPTS